MACRAAVATIQALPGEVTMALPHTPRLHIRKLMLALAAGAALLASACISVEGQSSGEMKQSMVRSFLFQSADVFYPGGVLGEPGTLPTLGRAQIGEIQTSFESISQTLQAEHKTSKAALEQLFRRSLPNEIKTRVAIVNTGTPIARIGAQGNIDVDAKVAQALFRTALVAGLRKGSFMSVTRGRSDSTPKTETESIAEFLKFKHDVESAQGKSMVGDMVSALRDDENGSWFKMVDLAEVSRNVELHYFGPIRFMLAHEMGHVALGHYDRLRTTADNDCAALKAMETEADAYATMLLSLQLARGGAMSFGGFGGDMFGFDALTGYEDFFKLTYEMAGFERAGVAADCSHPPAAERLASARKIHEGVQQGVNEAMNAAVDRAYREAAASAAASASRPR